MMARAILNNIERSERVIASVLHILLDKGLQDAWELSFEDLELSEDFEPFFGGAIKWLISEGIIRAEGVSEYINASALLISPTLTSRGFAILGHKFTIEGRAVTAVELVDAKSKGSPTYTGVGDFLGGILGGFTKSIGS
jgi:hypothetical protein